MSHLSKKVMFRRFPHVFPSFLSLCAQDCGPTRLWREGMKGGWNITVFLLVGHRIYYHDILIYGDLHVHIYINVYVEYICIYIYMYIYQWFGMCFCVLPSDLNHVFQRGRYTNNQLVFPCVFWQPWLKKP